MPKKKEQASFFSDEKNQELIARGYEDLITNNAFDPYRYVIDQKKPDHRDFFGLSTLLSDIAAKKRNPFTGVPIELSNIRVDPDYLLRMLEVKRDLVPHALDGITLKRTEKDVAAILNAVGITRRSTGCLWRQYSPNALYAASAYRQLTHAFNPVVKTPVQIRLRRHQIAAKVSLAALYGMTYFLRFINFNAATLSRFNEKLIYAFKDFTYAGRPIAFSEMLIGECPEHYVRYRPQAETFYVDDSHLINVLSSCLFRFSLFFLASAFLQSYYPIPNLQRDGGAFQIAAHVIVSFLFSADIIPRVAKLESVFNSDAIWKAVVCREHYKSSLNSHYKANFSAFETLLISPGSHAAVLSAFLLFSVGALAYSFTSRYLNKRLAASNKIEPLATALNVIEPDLKTRNPGSATLFFEDSPRVEPALDAEIKPECGE